MELILLILIKKNIKMNNIKFQVIKFLKVFMKRQAFKIIFKISMTIKQMMNYLIFHMKKLQN